jgi:transposase
MEPMYYIGLDVHKRSISYCVKDGSGKVHSQGKIPPAKAIFSATVPRKRTVSCNT